MDFIDLLKQFSQVADLQVECEPIETDTNDLAGARLSTYHKTISDDCKDRVEGAPHYFFIANLI